MSTERDKLLQDPVTREKMARRAGLCVVGFDSAWTERNAGAICSLAFNQAGDLSFQEPRTASFSDAVDFIRAAASANPLCIVAIDQPTIVPNAMGCRPVDRVAASLVSYIGGGVQPANRGKSAMFGDDAPIWRFKRELRAVEDPVAARTADAGLFLMEVFPALALPVLNVRFDGRYGAPKYNPRNRRQFKRDDWQEVTDAVASHGLYCCFPDVEVMHWAKAQADIERPVKGDQDRLDAVICALIGMIWRTADHPASAMIGDLDHGYMVTPVSRDSRQRLSAAASKCDVPFAGPPPARNTVEDESEFDHHLYARRYEKERKAKVAPQRG